MDEKQEVWLAVDVACAECSNGESLVTPLGTFASLDAAKVAMEGKTRGPWEQRRSYDRKPLPGVCDRSGDGAIEIFPVPPL